MSKPIFDADAPFSITLGLPSGADGTKRSIKHLFAPLTDADVSEYERRRQPKLIVHKESSETQSETIKAICWLYGKLATGIERSWTDAPPVAEWKDKIIPQQKTVLVDAIMSAELTAADGLGFDEYGGDGQAFNLTFTANETRYETLHVLKPVTAEQMDRFERMRSRQQLVGGRRGQGSEIRLPNNAKSIGALYDEIIDRTEGYAGRVPLPHKLIVVNEAMNTAATVTEGNGNALKVQ